jgi:hypothetical protein
MKKALRFTVKGFCVLDSFHVQHSVPNQHKGDMNSVWVVFERADRNEMDVDILVSHHLNKEAKT